jgi:hypothetical protein
VVIGNRPAESPASSTILLRERLEAAPEERARPEVGTLWGIRSIPQPAHNVRIECPPVVIVHGAAVVPPQALNRPLLQFSPGPGPECCEMIYLTKQEKISNRCRKEVETCHEAFEVRKRLCHGLTTVKPLHGQVVIGTGYMSPT